MGTSSKNRTRNGKVFKLMKTFWQLILELTAYQKLEKDSWAKAAARKAALPNPTVKTSLPWAQRNDATGWYHPTQKSFLFAFFGRWFVIYPMRPVC